MDSYAATLARMPDLREAIEQHPERYRVLTGERPTGRLHLGHYFGTIRERVRLQDAGVATFVILADYQVITDRDSAGDVRGAVYGAVLDYLAAGLDPTSTTIFTHSAARSTSCSSPSSAWSPRQSCTATRRSRPSSPHPVEP